MGVRKKDNSHYSFPKKFKKQNMRDLGGFIYLCILTLVFVILIRALF